MLRSVLAVGAVVLSSGTPTPYTHQPPTPVGDEIVLRSAPFPTCGHVEYKTDVLTKSKHLLRIYDCDGHATGPDVEVQFPDIISHWAVNHMDGSNNHWPVIAGRSGGFVMAYIDNSYSLHTVLFDMNGAVVRSELEVDNQNGLGQFQPDLAMLAGGRFAMTWHSVINYNLHLSVFEADGTRSVHAEEIAPHGPRPKIAALADGGWVISYSVRGAVNVMMESLGGVRRSFQVSQTGTDAENVAGLQPGYSNVATLSNGGFAVTWLYRKDSLFMRYYDSTGVPTTGMTQMRHPRNLGDDDKQYLYTLAGIGVNGWEGFVLSWVEVPSAATGYQGVVVREYSGTGALTKSYDLFKGYRPNVYFMGAGYGIDFFALVSVPVRSQDTETFLATCATLPASATCPPTASVSLPDSTPCAVYPCNNVDSCCRPPHYFYGVRQNGVELPLTPVSGSDSVAAAAGDLSLVQLPNLYQQMDVFFPTLPVTQGEVFEVECGSSAMCSFLVVVYHCPPCSKGHNLGFPSTLPLAGWSAGSCAPKFEVNGQGYPMTAFKLDVAGGDKVPLPATQTGSEYVAVFGQQTALSTQWCQKAQGPLFNGASGCHSCL